MTSAPTGGTPAGTAREPSRGEVNKVVVASLTGTMLAFTTYALGFLARPFGGVFFGHFGDRIGRKSMLVITLTLMGGATFLIGLMPTYTTLGIGAAVILTLLRLVQGFALGGEWGGAVLMAAEYGQAKRRGLRASLPQAGVPLGLLLSTGVLSLVSANTSDAQFLAWGWRVPFLLSIVLVAVGLWVRLTVAESPVFREAQQRVQAAAAEARRDAPPFLQVISRYRREVLVAMGARIAENVSYYLFTVFVLVYIADHLKMSKQVGLNALLIAALVHLVAIPSWAYLSDRYGRRPVYLFGATGVGVWAFVFFFLLDAKSAGLVTLAIAGGLVFHAAMYGPQAAFFSELFGTKVRYTGASVGYQLASVVAGSVAPLIAAKLLSMYGTSTPISVYLAICAAITIVAILLARETRKSDLSAVETEQEELVKLGP